MAVRVAGSDGGADESELWILRVVSLRNNLQPLGLAQSGEGARFSSERKKEEFPCRRKRPENERPAKIVSPSVSVSPLCYSFLPAFSSITWSWWVRVILSRSFLVSPFFWHLQNSLPNSTFLIIFGTPISNILGHCAPLTLAPISQAFDRGRHVS